MQIQSIEGPVTTKGYEKQIQLESIDFEIKRDLHTRVGNTSSREGSLPQLGKFIVKKFVDKTSPDFFKYSASGKPFPKVTINFTTTGSSPETYLMYELSEVIMSSYEISEDDLFQLINPDTKLPQKAIEVISLDFTQMQQSFVQYDASGNPQPSNKVLWNVSTGQVE